MESVFSSYDEYCRWSLMQILDENYRDIKMNAVDVYMIAIQKMKRACFEKQGEIVNHKDVK